MSQQQQHGDVLLLKLTRLPENLVRRKPRVDGKIVLADGEVTGHAHVMDCETAVLMEDKDGTLYLDVKDNTVLTHEEHGPQTVEPGMYEIGRVVEVDPFEDEVRVVAD